VAHAQGHGALTVTDDAQNRACEAYDVQVGPHSVEREHVVEIYREAIDDIDEENGEQVLHVCIYAYIYIYIHIYI
jgi:hypothetical protein